MDMGRNGQSSFDGKNSTTDTASDTAIKITTDFLATMFAASESNRFFIGSRPNDSSEDIDSPYEEKFINTSRIAAAKLPAFLRKWDAPGRAMYFCVGILKDKTNKRRKVNIAESCFLHADIDLEHIDGDKFDDVVRKLKAQRFPPSMIVASGHGLHVYWLFNEPVPSTEMKRIEKALKLLADFVGGDREPTHIAAFLRLPGSHNSKNGEWNEVRIVEQNTLRYELDDLEEMISERAPIILRKQREQQHTVGESNEFEAYGKKFETPIKIETRLREMLFMGGDINGVHPTQLDVSAAMHNHGFEVDDIVKTIIAATRIAAGTYGANWDWDEEEERVRNMTLTWIEKLEEKEEENPQSTADLNEDEDEEDDTAPSMSEESIALIFAERHAGLLRHVSKWGYWLIWQAGRWLQDETTHAFDLARKICREAARQCSNKPKQAKIIASARTVAAVERLAKADRRIAAAADQFDAQQYLFNSADRTINLKTGKAQLPQQGDYLTKVAGTRLAPVGTPHPIWTKFLKRVTNNDQEMIKFLQRYVGYCLSGDVSEHCFVFAYGTGANGKSTFIGTIQNIFGDYAVVASMDTFLSSHTDRHPTELAKLRGARLVVATETQAGRTWDEQKIKAITGGEKLTARFMRQDFFDFFPTFKLFVSGNHRPRLRNVDEAMKRRMLLVPFLVCIPKKERDPKLPEKLKKEWPAILRWCLDGCLEWQRIGLAPPTAVVTATNDYFNNEDSLGQWLEDECDVDVGNDRKWDKVSNLFDSWTEYIEANGEKPGSKMAFSEALTGRGFIACKKAQVRAFSGIQLNTAAKRSAKWTGKTGQKPKF
jgi:putative DNA primase/helicase